MNIEDLKDFNEEEIKILFIDLINKMENESDINMKVWEKDKDIISYYIYGAALLTKVNFVRNKILLKNETY